MELRSPLLLACVAALSMAAACQRETVTHVRVAKSAEGTPQPMRARAGPFMGRPSGGGGPMQAPSPSAAPAAPAAGQVEPPPPPDAASALQWKLPAGWTVKRESGMRYATLHPAAPSKVEVSVVVLPGVAGGELANVNRWRGQLGLAPIDEAQLTAMRKPMQTDAGPLELFDLLSEGKEKSRMLAAVLATESGSTWFLKMTGSADAVAAKQSEFVRLLSSLHFGAGNE